MNRPLICIVASLTSLLLAGCAALTGKDQKKFLITFHVQGTDMDSPRSIFRQTIPGKPYPVVFKVIPEFSQNNIAAMHAFPAESGNGFGATLRLDFRGANALDLITRTRTGEIMLAMVNGQAVDYVTIDRPVNDGVITIWEGIPQQVITEMEKKYPPINKLRSMSNGQEMLPTTKAEKRRSKREADAMLKAEQQKAKKEGAGTNAVPAVPPAPNLPPLEKSAGNGLPPAQTTNKIPIEGGLLQQPPLMIKPGDSNAR